MTLHLRPLPELPRDTIGPLRVSEISRVVCETFGIGITELLSDRRSRQVSFPRQAAYLLAKEFTFHSLPALAREFRRGDHSTVVHGIRAATDRMATDPEFRDKVCTARVRLTQLGQAQQSGVASARL